MEKFLDLIGTRNDDDNDYDEMRWRHIYQLNGSNVNLLHVKHNLEIANCYLRCCLPRERERAANKRWLQIYVWMNVNRINRSMLGSIHSFIVWWEQDWIKLGHNTIACGWPELYVLYYIVITLIMGRFSNNGMFHSDTYDNLFVE